MITERAEAAASFLKTKNIENIDLAVILGSGISLNTGAEVEFGYSDTPGFYETGVSGHKGILSFHKLYDKNLLLFQGRYHLYEGCDPTQVVLPVLTLAGMGVKKLLVTNAAGALNPSFNKGDIMIITDQINLTGENPLIGLPGDYDKKFMDMSGAYNKTLIKLLKESSVENDIQVREGIYAGVKGPSYETPAELEFLRRIGADAVGMSTVLEVIAARYFSMDVAGFSLITNQPLTKGKTKHQEVVYEAARHSVKISKLIEGFVKLLPKGE